VFHSGTLAGTFGMPAQAKRLSPRRLHSVSDAAVSLHRLRSMSARFTILIEGIDDREIAADVERTIRASFHEMALPGAWRVVVKPSPVGGRFDFQVEGLDVRHAMSLSVPPALLPSLIPRRLRDSINQSLNVSGLSRAPIRALRMA
jgi:hypothetical protein